MNLIAPNPGGTPNPETGPQYALDQNQDLLIIDAHNHSPGSGVAITPAGMDISTNLNFQNNSPYNVYSVVFSAPAPTSSLTTLYTNTQTGGGLIDLFFNDGAGNVIALTKAGEVNATIASLPGESYAGGTFTWKQGSGSTTPANFDIGSVTIRPNVAATTNGVVLGPPSAISSQYNVQLPIVPAQTSIMQLDTSGNMLATLVTDNSSIVISSQVLQIGTLPTHSVSQSTLAPRSSGSTVAAGGVAISAVLNISLGVSTNPIGGLSITITTTGRPVKVFLQSASGSGNSNIAITTGDSAVILNNNGTPFASYEIEMTTALLKIPTSSINMLDMTVNGTPGTYTYTMGVSVTSGSIAFADCYLMAYEI
jgi:hypothetical protein